MDSAPVFPHGNAAGLTWLDLACGMPLGTGDFTKLPPAPKDATLEGTLELACERLWPGPVYLGFSGGRESSMHLAVATDYARRHGRSDPIPVTLDHPGLVSKEERDNQERVVAHLGLSDWERVRVDEDLDLIGPLAARMLREAGAIWPAHGYIMAPLFARSTAGVFDMTTGTMDFFAFWRWAPLASVLAGHRRPRAGDARMLAASLAPARLRARLARSRGIPPPMPWMRPAAERRALDLLVGRQSVVPIRFDRAVATQVTHRCLEGGWRSFQAMGAAVGATVVQPLGDPDLLARFARAGGWRGFGNRRETMERTAGRLLPAGALAGRAAADGADIYFGEASRAFAKAWDGEGLDTNVIDPEALRRTWTSRKPDSRTACLLQYAWLRTSAPRATTTEISLEP